jgi:uncharacterized protein (DUF1330 family)
VTSRGARARNEPAAGGAKITLVAILTVRKDAVEKFREYETRAAGIMTDYGGRIERTVVVAPDASPEVVKEVHLVTFPSAEAFAAYREDERLVQAAELRNEAVVHTEILVGVWTSNPRGALKVAVEDPSLVSKYAFGTRTAEFHVCARCGIVPVVTSRIEGRPYVVVSANAFEGVDPALPRRSPASFDGEGTDSRLARRRRPWIADVEFVEGRL